MQPPPDNLAYDPHLLNVCQRLRTRKNVFRAVVTLVPERKNCDRCDIAFVERSRGRATVGPAHYFPFTNLWRPEQAIGGESAGSQECPLEARLLDELLDVGVGLSDRIRLSFKCVAHRRRRKEDDAACVFRDGTHDSSGSGNRSGAPEQKDGLNSLQAFVQRAGKG